MNMPTLTPSPMTVPTSFSGGLSGTGLGGGAAGAAGGGAAAGTAGGRRDGENSGRSRVFVSESNGIAHNGLPTDVRVAPSSGLAAVAIGSAVRGWIVVSGVIASNGPISARAEFGKGPHSSAPKTSGTIL